MTEELRVVIVDDEPDVAALHERLVASKDGFVVSAVVHHGQAALRAVERHRPHVVVLDFGLPDIDGREVLRRLRASNRANVEVIAVTAAKDLDSVRYARSAGVHHYLVKPFAVSALWERLDRVMAERRALAATGAGDLQQESVDRILAGASEPSKVNPLPKGLGPQTLERVRKALQDESGGLSAAEIAQMTGTSRVTARRYLEYMHRCGEVLLQPQYGKGRPINRYVTRKEADPEAPSD